MGFQGFLKAVCRSRGKKGITKQEKMCLGAKALSNELRVEKRRLRQG